jgi:hypothetical protein
MVRTKGLVGIERRVHQRLCEDLQGPKFAVAFNKMSAEIDWLQGQEQDRKALNISKKERIGYRNRSRKRAR